MFGFFILSRFNDSSYNIDINNDKSSGKHKMYEYSVNI